MHIELEKSKLHKLSDLLLTKKLKIAVAESISCGHLQSAFGSISGCSAFFQGGLTVYQTALKINLLGVDKLHANSVNAVSEKVALQMATGVCGLFGADIGIATTGYAEPSPEWNIQYPMAYFSICRVYEEKITEIYADHVLGSDLNRVQMQQKVSYQVICALLSYLEQN